VVNVTPDSFSDGGRFLDAADAVAQACGWRRGSRYHRCRRRVDPAVCGGVWAEEEIRRVVPVIAELAGRIRIPISIDTTKAAVARRALEAGAAMVNDIAALRFDPGLAGWRPSSECR